MLPMLLPIEHMLGSALISAGVAFWVWASVYSPLAIFAHHSAEVLDDAAPRQDLGAVWMYRSESSTRNCSCLAGLKTAALHSRWPSSWGWEQAQKQGPGWHEHSVQRVGKPGFKILAQADGLREPAGKPGSSKPT